MLRQEGAGGGPPPIGLPPFCFGRLLQAEFASGSSVIRARRILGVASSTSRHGKPFSVMNSSYNRLVGP